MKSRYLILLASLFSVLVFAQASMAQGEIKGQFGDWKLRCDTPAGAQAEECALVQKVTAKDRDNIGLIVYFLKVADTKEPMLRVLAPLGILLPAGLGLRVDGVDIGNSDWLRCQPSGCHVAAILGTEQLTKLLDGKQALFIIFLSDEEGVGIPISLKGLKEGFAQLK